MWRIVSLQESYCSDISIPYRVLFISVKDWPLQCPTDVTELLHHCPIGVNDLSLQCISAVKELLYRGHYLYKEYV